MSRQINLYSPAFRRQSKSFSAAWTVVAVIAVAAGMSLDYVWEGQQLRDLRASGTASAAQLTQLRGQVAELAKRSAPTSSKALADEVARAENLLRDRRELIARLQRGEIGNRHGFANFLTALARRRVDGVWLTRIEISGPGSDFAIEGRTLRADLLPGYIKLLSNEEAFKGKAISALAMHEREIEAPGVRDAKEMKTPGATAGRQGGAVSEPPARPRGVRVVDFALGTLSGAAVASAATGSARR